MWIVCEALMNETQEDDERDPLLKRLMSDVTDESVWRRFCFNSSQVKDFNECETTDMINIYFYDNTSLTIKYDFDQMVELKKVEDPTIVYTA